MNRVIKRLMCILNSWSVIKGADNFFFLYFSDDSQEKPRFSLKNHKQKYRITGIVKKYLVIIME